MATQLEFLMQLYMMNLIQQQQQQLLQQQSAQQQQQQQHQQHQIIQQQQQQLIKDNSPTDLALKEQSSPGNCSSSNSSSMPISRESFNHCYNSMQLTNENDNFINNLYPVNFSKSFLQSSTVTSTPADRISAPPSPSPDTYDGDRDAEEDEPLYTTGTSGSTTTNSGDNSKLSGRILESTDSFSSPSMPFTPVKSENALSSSTSGQDLSIDNMRSFNTFVDNDDSNMSQKLSKVSPGSSGNYEGAKITVKSESCLVNMESSSFSNTNNTSNVDSLLQNDEILKYLRKFGSYLECENIMCQQENIREHFHCYDEPCCGKVLTKRDEIIRHLKWHKKRKESLTYGFLRFSSYDDCSTSFGENCIYNRKQTHYHCVEEGCSKVYVSTSDVQMHANYHRKNSEIIQEGFKRFRAIEDCKTESCPFFGKKTSHYHCRRDNCQFTFKNKSDMDKHKSYHLRDMRLTQDGFKKILKTEECPFENCRFSNVCNHIHCVRENCSYILHSSSQLVSHKRKHERLDGEQAYQNFKKAQKESSEEDSPKSSVQVDVSTPLSSLTGESSNFHFLARKRGRPPKKIQLSNQAKKVKTETSVEHTQLPPFPAGLPFSPFLPQLNAISQDGINQPNFQLTHLMAMFQLQNPLFYQNLYPGMFGLGGGTGPAAGMVPQNPIFPTPASTPSQVFVKSEDKQKE